MAITVSTSEWDDNISKRPSMAALDGSRLKIYKVKVTFGASDNYATNGVAKSLKEGKITSYLTVIPTKNSARVYVEYDETNEKILMFGEVSDDVAGTNANAKAFKELVNASTIPNSKTFEFLVFGI